MFRTCKVVKDSHKKLLLVFLPRLVGYSDRVAFLENLSTEFEGRCLIVSFGAPSVYRRGGCVHVVLKRSFKWLPTHLILLRMIPYLVFKYRGRPQIIWDNFGLAAPGMIVTGWFKNFEKKITSVYAYPYYDLFKFYLPNYNLVQLMSCNDTRTMIVNGIFQRLYLKFFHVVVVQADALTSRLYFTAPYITENQIRVVHNSIDAMRLGKFLSKNSDQLSSGCIRVVIPGTLCLARGADLAVGVISRLCEQMPNLEVVQIGGEASIDIHKKFAKQIYERLGERFISYPKLSADEYLEMVNSADLVLHLSRCDGSSRSILEALSLGIDVIALEHPGILHLQEFSMLPLCEDNIESVLSATDLWADTIKMNGRKLSRERSEQRDAVLKKYSTASAVEGIVKNGSLLSL